MTHSTGSTRLNTRYPEVELSKRTWKASSPAARPQMESAATAWRRYPLVHEAELWVARAETTRSADDFGPTTERPNIAPPKGPPGTVSFRKLLGRKAACQANIDKTRDFIHRLTCTLR